MQLSELLSTLVFFSDAYLKDDMSATHWKATEVLPDIINKSHQPWPANQPVVQHYC